MTRSVIFLSFKRNITPLSVYLVARGGFLHYVRCFLQILLSIPSKSDGDIGSVKVVWRGKFLGCQLIWLVLINVDISDTNVLLTFFVSTLLNLRTRYSHMSHRQFPKTSDLNRYDSNISFVEKSWNRGRRLCRKMPHLLVFDL